MRNYSIHLLSREEACIFIAILVASRGGWGILSRTHVVCFVFKNRHRYIGRSASTACGLALLGIYMQDVPHNFSEALKMGNFYFMTTKLMRIIRACSDCLV